jgi:predicted naringenin-chalcone synthase
MLLPLLPDVCHEPDGTGRARREEMTSALGLGFALSGFSMRRPPHEISQSRSLDWIVEAHTAAATRLESLDADGRRTFSAKMRRVVDRVACDATSIGKRGHVVPDVGRPSWEDGVVYDLAHHPHGRGIGARTKFYADAVARYFAEEYAEETPPSDMIHVTCTGYVSPSGAQRVVASRGWGELSRVTHAYHMGCYAAFPAIRMASGFLATPDPMRSPATRGKDRRVDVVHTELCSLHFDPANHSLEQVVVQSLFADGFIRYSVTDDAIGVPRGPCLRVLALNEAILPESAESMGWMISDNNIAMTLSRDVPGRIGAALHGFVLDLFTRAGLDAHVELPTAVFAVHPGGPKIIDTVRDRLELSDLQVQTSRDVLFDYGNMSSATLPHVWMRIVDDPRVATGSLVVSLAFGPGLTVCGSIFRKH